MKYTLLLFFLFNTFSVLLSMPTNQYIVENKSLGVANRYIDFTGKTGVSCRVKTVNKVDYHFLALYLYAEMTGFTSPYNFKLYLTDRSYAYMTCTVPISTGTTSYIECDLDYEKFFSTYWTLNLPNEFPQIYDCQVSFWEKVSKSIYTTCSAQYHESYRYSLITWPLCDSTNQNFIQAKGGLYSHISSGEPLKSEYSFSVPVYIDGIETNIPCSISWIESDIWGYKCFISGGNKIKFFDTLITHSKTKIWIRISWEVKLVNCQNPDKLIRFVNVTPKCTTVNTKKTLLVDFSAHVFGFYEKENFILPLEDPSYAYLECTIPKSPISSAEKLINCILDINKFPLYSNRKITLPSNFPDINCEVTHWQNINKLQNIGVCYPSFYGDITPQIIHDPICAKEDYNILVFSSTIGFSSSQNYFSFDLNVLIDGKNSVMPCELFTSYFYIDTYFPMFCYNKGNGILSFFETTVTIENKYTPLFNISLDKKINLDICSVTEKIIFFENVNTICSVVNNNQYFVNVQLYAKIIGFKSNYSFFFTFFLLYVLYNSKF